MTQTGRRGRSRDATLAALKDGLSRLRDAKQRITISAVARQAGVTPSLLHNRYPALVEEIRRHLGADSRSEVGKLREQLEATKKRIREVVAEVEELKRELKHLASENEALRRSAVHSCSGNVVSLRRG